MMEVDKYDKMQHLGGNSSKILAQAKTWEERGKIINMSTQIILRALRKTLFEGEKRKKIQK